MKKIYLTLVILTCLFSFRSFSQCTTPTTVPYYEGFNSIAANQLPTCWAISNPSTCTTFTASSTQGNAVFYYTPSGSNYFYSMGIQLNAGITYSASAWYKVATNNNITWTDFSIMLGTSQSSTGLVTIASTNGAAVNILYTVISNTFTVASSGVYYVAIRGISNGGSSGSPFLTWDDLAIELPCTTAYNSPSLTVVTNTSTICNGKTFSATVTGADTYSWNTGSSASAFTATPTQNMQYSVLGTNTLSGCTATLNLPYVNVISSPNIIIIPDKPTVCIGTSANLMATGAATYSWSTGATTSSLLITPSVMTVYSVVGTGTNGCSSSMSYTATVNPLPVVTYSSSAATQTVCKGEVVTFTASSPSAVNYQWSSSSIPVTAGNVFNLTASITTTITLKGADQNGCDNKISIVLNVDNCTGIMQSTASLGFKIYPNPGNGDYTLESGNSELKSLVVTDLVGKIVFTTQTYNEQIKINIKDFPIGMYNAKIIFASKTETLKLIKE